MKGTVKFYNRKKGFGFISGDDGNDYFVHFTALPRGLSLRDNDKVSFDGTKGDRGLKAENVQLLEKASERTETEERTSPSEEGSQDEEESMSDESEEESGQDQEEEGSDGDSEEDSEETSDDES